MNVDKISFRLKPVAPFELKYTAWALQRRPGNIIDRWDGKVYRRALVYQAKPVEVEVTQKGAADRAVLLVTATAEIITPELKSAVIGSLESLLGLRIDLSNFYEFAMGQKKLDELAQRFRGMKPPRFPSLFEALVNAISCQQLSLIVGIKILSRLAVKCGLPFKKEDLPVYTFAQPEKIARLRPETFRKMGFSRQKSRALSELSQGVIRGSIRLDSIESLDDAAALEQLYQLRGVGRWSAEYTLLRGMGRTTFFPGDDVGAQNKLKSFLGLRKPLDYKGVARLLHRWHPFGGLIYFHLLLDGLEKEGYL